MISGSRVNNILPKEVFKTLPSGVDYTLIPSDHGKRLIVSGVMNITIPNGLGEGFFCTVTKTDIAIQTLLVSGTMTLASNSLINLETIDTSVIIAIQGLIARAEGRLT